MELKVYVSNVPKIVYGLTEETTAHDVILALAQSIRKTGRFCLILNDNGQERFLSPQEKIIKILGYSKSNADLLFFLKHNSEFDDDEQNKPLSEYERLVSLIDMQQTRLNNQTIRLNDISEQIEKYDADVGIEGAKFSSAKLMQNEAIHLQNMVQERDKIEEKVTKLKREILRKENMIINLNSQFDKLKKDLEQLKEVKESHETINQMKRLNKTSKKQKHMNDENLQKIGYLIESLDKDIATKIALIRQLESEFAESDEEIEQELSIIFKIPRSNSTDSISLKSKRRIFNDASRNYMSTSLYELYKLSPTTVSTLENDKMYNRPHFVSNKCVSTLCT